ncbi:MAG: DUF547 domain-containing protein [Gammaproteobacteria bacterium]
MTFRFLLALLCAICATAAGASEPDWRDYEDILERYVARGVISGVELNQVDYAGLSHDPKFARVVAQLSEFSLNRLSSREETLSFYINAYNILALKTVLDHWPVESITDIGNVFRSVWKRRAGFIGGEHLSLDDIEHKRLRTMNEPRVHFAIVCASVSCPDLRREPYRAQSLNAQLDLQCTDFLNNPHKGLKISGARADVSKIFKWFGDDFESAGGVDAFIRRYRAVPETVRIRPGMNYNWSLNGR